MPAAAEELLADAKKAVVWLHGMARTSKIAERTWTTMSCVLVKATRRVGIDAGDDFYDGSIESLDGWVQSSAANPTGSNQIPLPAMDSHQPQPSTPVHFGVPSVAPPAFENLMPYANDTDHSNQGHVRYENAMKPEAF